MVREFKVKGTFVLMNDKDWFLYHDNGKMEPLDKIKVKAACILFDINLPAGPPINVPARSHALANGPAKEKEWWEKPLTASVVNVLSLVAEYNDPIKVQELITLHNIPRGTASSCMTQLKHLNYVTAGKDNRYIVTPEGHAALVRYQQERGA